MTTTTKPAPWSERICPLPQSTFIGRGPDTEHLYQAEDRITKNLHVAAKEMAALLGHDENEFWRRSMASAILSVLENHQKEASIAAAVAFLRAHGVVVNNGHEVALPRGCKELIELRDDEIAVRFFSPTR